MPQITLIIEPWNQHFTGGGICDIRDTGCDCVLPNNGALLTTNLCLDLLSETNGYGWLVAWLVLDWNGS